jgi:hypothetical protein
MSRIYFGCLSIWALAYLTYVIINLDTYSEEHGKTLIAFWVLISILAIKKYWKEEREWRKKRQVAK